MTPNEQAKLVIHDAKQWSDKIRGTNNFIRYGDIANLLDLIQRLANSVEELSRK